MDAEEPFLLSCISLLATGLGFIWENRMIKKVTTLIMMRAELEAAVSIRRRSRLPRIREAGDIMSNIIANFVG